MVKLATLVDFYERITPIDLWVTRSRSNYWSLFQHYSFNIFWTICLIIIKLGTVVATREWIVHCICATLLNFALLLLNEISKIPANKHVMIFEDITDILIMLRWELPPQPYFVTLFLSTGISLSTHCTKSDHPAVTGVTRMRGRQNQNQDQQFDLD